jgi:hypothetical protein
LVLEYPMPRTFADITHSPSHTWPM